MEIKLIASTNNRRYIEEFLKSGQNYGRVCYSEKDFEEIEQEETNSNLIKRMLTSGHHSPFEHDYLTFYIKDIPKAMAILLNNERPYVTSEKSARYTQMRNMLPKQKEKYNKWMEIFCEEIGKVYPQLEDREERIKKLSQENARYMSSVFTQTKMVHTLSVLKLNQILHEAPSVIEEYRKSNNEFKKRLSNNIEEFANQMDVYKIRGLENQTERHISLFGNKVEEHFGDTYSTNYAISFAALAQAHRHRTIHYSINKEIELNEDSKFFIPEIIKERKSLVNEWANDLRIISKEDFPQAQLISISERGNIEDFRSKMILRLCGQAQYEIMKNTLNTASQYSYFRENIKGLAKPYCLQGKQCKSPCVWGPKMALERIV